MNEHFEVYSLSQMPDRVPELSCKQLLNKAFDSCNIILNSTIYLLEKQDGFSEQERETISEVHHKAIVLLVKLNTLILGFTNEPKQVINKIEELIEGNFELRNLINQVDRAGNWNGIKAEMNSGNKRSFYLAYADGTTHSISSYLFDIKKGIELNLPDWYETITSGKWGNVDLYDEV